MPSETNGAHADVIVVGAGLAGLCAARELVRRGVRCLVLEARDRVGGRTLSHRLGRDVIDLGGQWIGPKQHRLAALTAELGIERCPQYDSGTKILSWGGNIQRYQGDLPRLSILAQLELLWASKKLEAFQRELPPEGPWAAPRAKEWDSMTLETWKRRNMRTAGARLFLDIVTRAVLTSEPRDVSFLYFLNYLRSGQGLESLISIRGGAAGAVCRRRAADLAAPGRSTRAARYSFGACAIDRTACRWRDRPQRGWSVCGRAGHRGRATAAGRTDSLRVAAVGHARSNHSAHADGLRYQVRHRV